MSSVIQDLYRYSTFFYKNKPDLEGQAIDPALRDSWSKDHAATGPVQPAANLLSLTRRRNNLSRQHSPHSLDSGPWTEQVRNRW